MYEACRAARAKPFWEQNATHVSTVIADGGCTHRTASMSK
jgi:hypothetical protein